VQNVVDKVSIFTVTLQSVGLLESLGWRRVGFCWHSDQLTTALGVDLVCTLWQAYGAV